jgi:hypothetical protein
LFQLILSRRHRPKKVSTPEDFADEVLRVVARQHLEHQLGARRRAGVEVLKLSFNVTDAPISVQNEKISKEIFRTAMPGC